MEQKQQLKELFIRYLNGTCSREDVDTLLAYFGSPESEREWKELIEQALQDDVDFAPIDRQIRAVDESAFKVIQAHIGPAKVRYWSFVRIAASIVLLLGIGWIVYQYSGKPTNDGGDLLVGTVIQQDIDPGRDRAILSLDDGQEFVLDGSGEGIVNSSDAVRYPDGKLVASIDVPRQVTLRTPMAGQYQATLPDGTKVWLNAASEIRYPSTFNRKSRRVSIRGEVYLEVAKDPTKPFYVETTGQHIEVLGTHFNVNAYGDQGAVWTTLREGRVRVIQSESGREVVLKPGQQAQNNPVGALTLREVDVDQVLSWKEGMYILRDQELGLFGKQIERWYDVEVDMGAYTSRKLSAIIPRSAKLSTVLEAITLETGIHFKIEGRRVIARRN